jgi:hypothetical protein
MQLFKMVGARGFEPPTSCTPFRCGCVHSVLCRPLRPFSPQKGGKTVHCVHIVHRFRPNCTRIAHEINYQKGRRL